MMEQFVSFLAGFGEITGAPLEPAFASNVFPIIELPPPSEKPYGYIEVKPGDVVSHPASFYNKKIKLLGYIESVKFAGNVARLRVCDRKPVLGLFGGEPIKVIFLVKNETQRKKLTNSVGKWLIAYGIFREKLKVVDPLFHSENFFVNLLIAKRLVLLDRKPPEINLEPEPEDVLD